MNILVIGNGGREHALAWKLAQSDQTQKIFVAPGNAGTAIDNNKIQNVPIQALDFAALIHFAKHNAIDFTVVGPEAPLSAGIVDEFQRAGLRCLGPSKMAAQLEASKAFSKNFMQEHNIPTAKYANFTDASSAIAYVKKQNLPIVIKADGLAAGKGVVIAQTLEEACRTIEDMLTAEKFGSASQCIVIEEFLKGVEASFIVLCDGVHCVPLATAQDHKTRDDGDKGPNTGGMGAYSPAPIITSELQAMILTDIIQPTMTGMTNSGHPYVGFLYAGLMIDNTDQKQPAKVLEFNCRLGDPETQVILPRLQTDLVTLCQAALAGTLNELELTWDPRSALGVVLAAQGYPDDYRRGDKIMGLEPAKSTSVTSELIFHAGTMLKDGDVYTNGGRVLCATGMGDTLLAAKKIAYQLASKISWPGRFYRHDIGDKGLN